MKSYTVPKVSLQPDNRPEWMLPPPASENPNIQVGDSTPKPTTLRPTQPSTPLTTPTPSVVTEVVTTTSVSFVTSSVTSPATPQQPTTTTTTSTLPPFIPTSVSSSTVTQWTPTPESSAMDCSQQDFYPHPTDCTKVIYYLVKFTVFDGKLESNQMSFVQTVLLVRVWKPNRI